MIQQKIYKCKNKLKQICTYSDEGKYIIQNETGVKYEEAIDVEGAPYTYSETDEYIINPEENNTESEV